MTNWTKHLRASAERTPDHLFPHLIQMARRKRKKPGDIVLIRRDELEELKRKALAT